ncbi:ribonuclease P protein component [Chitinivibrio alkaliphilus ACht1]|uniref:Ribonuclease P protein component n=1 Tax=Chitinivibrio alkaliphilus ACht1 TaxID=1313304 RepID=U7D6H9_9BACT|nr:ribonuclease P protein component [Chitinivibrio alkaliphilus ACht1]
MSQGDRWRCDIFALIYRENRIGVNRHAVLVSRKNGPAVERVRIKRIYREVYKNSSLIPSAGIDILIRPFYGVHHEYARALRRFEAWCETVG